VEASVSHWRNGWPPGEKVLCSATRRNPVQGRAAMSTAAQQDGHSTMVWLHSTAAITKPPPQTHEERKGRWQSQTS
jgi:hypothetical protein